MKHKHWCGRWSVSGLKGAPVLVFTIARRILCEET